MRDRLAYFLRTYTRSSEAHGSTPVYLNAIRLMCNNNLQSVEVSFVDLSMVQPQIAIWLADEPSILIDCFNTVFLPLSPPV